MLFRSIPAYDLECKKTIHTCNETKIEETNGDETKYDEERDNNKYHYNLYSIIKDCECEPYDNINEDKRSCVASYYKTLNLEKYNPLQY